MINDTATNDNPDILGTMDPYFCKRFRDFEAELSVLINKNCLENTLEMPDFILAKLLTNILKEMYTARASNDNWHGMVAYPDDYKELKKE